MSQTNISPLKKGDKKIAEAALWVIEQSREWPAIKDPRPLTMSCPTCNGTMLRRYSTYFCKSCGRAL
jgi:ribosomal protein L37AE/L43A